jgi:hypothetical protein
MFKFQNVGVCLAASVTCAGGSQDAETQSPTTDQEVDVRLPHLRYCPSRHVSFSIKIGFKLVFKMVKIAQIGDPPCMAKKGFKPVSLSKTQF